MSVVRIFKSKKGIIIFSGTIVCLAAIIVCGITQYKDVEIKSDFVEKMNNNQNVSESYFSKEMVGNSEIDVSKLKLVKRGMLNIEVGNYNTATKAIDSIIKYNNGFIISESEHCSDERISHNLEIKTTSSNFDNLVSKLVSAASKITLKKITVDDVTAQYADISAHIDNKVQLEKKYVELLKKSATLTNTLEIETRISTVRREIDSLEGQQIFLDSKIVFSTIDLTFSHDLPHSFSPINLDKFLSQLSDGFTGGLKIFQYFLIGVSYLWIFVLIGSVVFLVLFIKRNKKKNIVK